jgi:hypothetical protein
MLHNIPKITHIAKACRKNTLDGHFPAPVALPALVCANTHATAVEGVGGLRTSGKCALDL